MITAGNNFLNGCLSSFAMTKSSDWLHKIKPTLPENAMTNVYASTHPLVTHKLSRLRDIKTEPKRFRELVREIAALLAYEATADLAVTPRELETPLAK
jgi:hypothetical protein